MKPSTVCHVRLTSIPSVALGMLVFFAAVLADEPRRTIGDPGFRPESEYATTFTDSVASAKIAVLPTLVRRSDRTAHSFSSQQQIVEFLNESGLTTAVAKPRRIDLGPLPRQSQWQVFESAMQGITQVIDEYQADADFILVMEFLVPDNQAVFGAECYILDKQGRNAFSFLLNSHHRIFADASLVAENATEAARNQMIEKATQVAMAALIRQINNPSPQQAAARLGASATAETPVELDDAAAERVFVVARLHERLIRVFMHSFKHSLTSAFQTNHVDATVMVAPQASDPLADFKAQIDAYAPDAIMLITIDPLYRKRRDGYQAIVGTEFDATLIDNAAGETTWQSSGKVDYIRMFGPRYVAHDGIRKEFAWSTTAGIVRAYMSEVHGRESAPIYTVTEDRARHGQRVD